MAGKTNETPDVIKDDDLEPVADETADRARLVVTAHSADADEATMLLNMLGIGPDTSTSIVESDVEEEEAK
ncbi:MAG TPA: hypothetical protein K8V11_12080 [Dietzia timorensis]|jgi:hypothetical protein|uniref:Uncharacterized protein n=1 Tax=Dietzia timorensis TaxID=499555 RepID=A0A921F6W8_9ACTN|nr:hypothetical protein [Dietzia timorensis]HJE91734.1 hypothetical protein [Dietzia timorensis]